MVATNLLKGLAIGGLIGSVLGILLTPKAGKETREQILNSTRDVLEKVKSQYEETAEKLATMKTENKEMLMDKKDRLQKALNAGVEAYKH